MPRPKAYQLAANLLTAAGSRLTEVRIAKGEAHEGSVLAEGAMDEITANEQVIVINETMARRFWPNEDPIGRTIAVWQGGFHTGATVIGITNEPGSPLATAVDLVLSTSTLDHFDARADIGVFTTQAAFLAAVSARASDCPCSVWPGDVEPAPLAAKTSTGLIYRAATARVPAMRRSSIAWRTIWKRTVWIGPIWWRHEYQYSGKPWQRMTSGPSPCSAITLRIRSAAAERRRQPRDEQDEIVVGAFMRLGSPKGVEEAEPFEACEQCVGDTAAACGGAMPASRSLRCPSAVIQSLLQAGASAVRTSTSAKPDAASRRRRSWAISRSAGQPE